MGQLIGAVVGGVLGYAVGFTLLVDEIGRVGHRMFWNSVLKGGLNERGIQMALESETFWQVAGPALIGLIIGVIVGGRLQRPPPQESNHQDD